MQAAGSQVPFKPLTSPASPAGSGYLAAAMGMMVGDTGKRLQRQGWLLAAVLLAGCVC